jgi:hypothetical protein
MLITKKVLRVQSLGAREGNPGGKVAYYICTHSSISLVNIRSRGFATEKTRARGSAQIGVSSIFAGGGEYTVHCDESEEGKTFF